MYYLYDYTFFCYIVYDIVKMRYFLHEQAAMILKLIELIFVFL